MQDLNDLYYFVQVVDHGGFAAAGRALGIPKSKLSRRIAELEARLGVRLLHRSTRRSSMTEIGQSYYAHCKAMLVEAQSAQEAIEMTRAEPCGVVRVTCPVALLEERVGEMLARFLVQHPRVELHLDATDRRVDVIAEAIDVAIRVRPPPLEDSELVLRVLSDRRQRLVASAQLLQRFGTPQMPADLAALPSLDLGAPRPQHAWHLLGPEGATAKVVHQPRLVTRNMIALRSAALAGVGVVQLPAMLVSEQLGRGELVCLVPDWAPPNEIVHAVFASRRGLLPAVRALLDFLAAGFDELIED
jgi:DNA-binding transcriptional LysR family regulator